MEEEDNEFFILVLGVLAAIILVVSWWYMSGGVATSPTPVVEAPAEVEAEVAAPAPVVAEPEVAEEVEPEPEPTAAPEEEAFELEPAEEEVVEDEPAPVAALPTTVFNAAEATPELSVLSGLLRDEGLDVALSDAGPFTVFAPTNDAISEAAASDTTMAVLGADRSSVLTYHVVPGTYTAQDLAELARGSRSAELVTLQGEPILLTLEGDNLIINGNSVVTGEALEADNGLVHSLNNLLVPPVAALNTLVGAEPILFDTGSATIQQESFATLDQLIEVLTVTNVNVNIGGHTDSTGDAVLNQNLSQSRARSVLNYLVANGIEEPRLSAEGFGSSQPVADNATEEGRALNRRIEFALR